MNRLSEKILNSDSIVFTKMIDGEMHSKTANKLNIGEYVLTFLIESLSPSLTGYFKYCKVIDKKNRFYKKSDVSLFHKKDGIKISLPENYNFISEGWITNINSKKIHSVYTFPVSCYDTLIDDFGISLFNTESNLLNEKLAFLIGACCARPHFYIKNNKTWTSFSYKINTSLPYSRNPCNVVLEELEYIFKSYQSIVQSCGFEFLFEKKYSRLKVDDTFLPDESNFKNPYLSSGNTHSGFSFHFPISDDQKLEFQQSIINDSTYKFQFWFSKIYPRMLQESPISVLKAFLCGIFDSTCSIDKASKKVGIDFSDGYSGTFPIYTGLDEICGKIFDNYKPDPTRYKRVYSNEGRNRGRLLRVNIDDYLSQVGFISKEKFERSTSIIESNKFDSFFPETNILTPALDVPVFTQNISQRGGDESDLKKINLYINEKPPSRKKFVTILLEEKNALCVSDFPLGVIGEPIKDLERKTYEKTKIRYDGSWELTFFDMLELFCKREEFDGDLVFEYLIALLFSKFNGCKEAFVVPRRIDDGIDAGAKYSVDSSGDTFEVVIQAKYQSKNVGRKVIDQLRGALGSKTRFCGSIGYVVTNTNFSPDSIRSSSKDYPIVKLINGSKLGSMLIKQKVGLELKNKSVLVNISFYQALITIIKNTRHNKEPIFLKIISGLPVAI